MKKKPGWVIAIVPAVYALLLAALTAVESAHEASSIRSFGDALWYSLVTITTVGYGDLYPVTPLGRAIGVFFLLLSLGFLAFILSTAYSLITGRFWPGLLLRLHRGKTWHVFSCRNSASLTLAEHLAREEPDSLQIFCRTPQDASSASLLSRHISLPEDAAHVLQRYPSKQGLRNVFLISDDDFLNCDEARALQGSGARLYCQSEEVQELPDVTFFDPFDSCARLYWQIHPLQRREACVLLAGSGRCAQAILSHAIVTNCVSPMRTVQYHLFGDWQPYLLAHHRLDQAFSLNAPSDQTDALFFHPQPWNADADLIARADRIIFCFDDEDENARCAQLLTRCYPHQAAIYVRTARQVVPGIRFGMPESLYTPELVMKHRLDHLAIQMHAHYCRSVDQPMPAWEELNAFTRASNRAAADHIATKVRLLLDSDDDADPDSCRRASLRWQQADDALRERCRHNEHDRWVRFHSLHNWQYAPVRDNAARRHTAMRPYEQLSNEERVKDDFAWQLLSLRSEIQEQP